MSATQTNDDSTSHFVDEVSKLLNLGTDFSNHLDFWTYSVQGEYLIVNCKANVAHLLLGDETREEQLPENLTFQNKKAIVEASSTVVHIPSWSVVRRGLVEGATINEEGVLVEEDTEMIDHRDGVLKTIQELKSFENAVVTYHPKYEGVMVYIWKHRGEVFFSTRKKLDARNSRHGNSRLLSELYDSLGGPSSFQLFPDLSEEDGEDVMYVFTIVHPSLFVVSKADVGEGFILFNGAFCSKTLRCLDLVSSLRVKWFHREGCVGEDNTNSYGESVLVDSSVQLAPRFEDSTVLTDIQVPLFCDIPPEAEDAIVEDIEKTLFQEDKCNEYGIWCPFPPPSKVSRPLPPKGDADEMAAKALGPYNEKVKLSEDFDESLLPPVYTWFSFGGLGEVSCYLNEGMISSKVEACVYDGRLCMSSFKESRFTPFTPGEPVVMKVVDLDSGVPTFYTIQPYCYDWKIQVAGTIANPSFRAGELRTLSEEVTNYQMFLESSGALPPPPVTHLPEYYHLFGGGVPLIFGKSSARIEFLLKRLADLSNEGVVLFSIPDFIVQEMEQQLQNELSYLSVSEAAEEVAAAEGRFHFIRRVHFGWACVNLGLASSPKNQLSSFKAYGEIIDMENRVASYFMKIYEPLVSFYLGQARQNRYGGRGGIGSGGGRGRTSVFEGFDRPEFKKKDGSFNVKLIDEIRDLVFRIRTNVTSTLSRIPPPSSPKSASSSSAEQMIMKEVWRCVRSIEGERLYTIFKVVKNVM